MSVRLGERELCCPVYVVDCECATPREPSKSCVCDLLQVQIKNDLAKLTILETSSAAFSND